MKQDQSVKKLTLLAAVVAAAVVSIVFNAFLSNRHSLGSGVKPDRYEEIRKRGTIIAGYYTGAPYFMVDANKQMENKAAFSGIFFEIMEKVAASLELEIEWKQEVSFPDMPQSLNDGKFDIIGSGIWINAARGSKVDFTTPVLFDAVCAYVRPDEIRFVENLSNLNSAEFTIATIDGEMADIIASTDFPKATTLDLPQVTPFSDLMLNLREGKADITFLGMAAAQDYLSQHPGSIKNITPQRPLRVFPTAIMVPMGEYTLKRVIDIALLEMLNTGQLENIIKKYEKIPGSHYRVASDYVLLAE